MGSMNAIAMKESVDEGLINLDAALTWHLRANHYPPIPLIMLEPCKLAIQYANAGEWNREMELPNGVTYKGWTTAPVSAIIEQHHLESFLDQDEIGE